MIFIGLTAFISLIVITIHFIYTRVGNIFHINKKPNIHLSLKYKKAFSILILLSVPIAITIVYKPVIENLFNEENNLNLVENVIFKCQPIEQQVTDDKNVILRLDDVQAYGWTDISIKIMYDVLNRDKVITAGVIPKNISHDRRIIEFFKKNDCNVEIAIHGYDHGGGEYGNEISGEFSLLNNKETEGRLNLAIKEINNISKQRPVTFIPPNNQLSSEARKSIQNEFLPIISAEGDNYFDYDISTWDSTTKSLTGAETVIKSCERAFSTGDNLCVIMIHPQDFSNNDMSINEDSYAEFTKILDYLESSNISVTTFNKMSAR